MDSETTLGWDIGGAHLKVAVLRSGRVTRVRCLPTPLWQGLGHLDRALESVRASVPCAQAHAITMTGELSDCFRDRAQGVRSLLARFERAKLGGTVAIYAGGSGFLGMRQAARATAAVASANWRATGELVARLSRDALLVDIGSTTTDLVPIRGGALQSFGLDDAGRLGSGELVYTGVVRTSLMAVVRTMRLGRRAIPVMAEHFATIADVYRLTGDLPAGADLHPAADGGAKSAAASARRLARMVGRDLEAGSMDAWKACAAGIAETQLAQIESAARLVASRSRVPGHAPVIGAGVGRFVARKLARRLGRPYRDFASLVPHAARTGSRIADCAPAVAVAVLLRGIE